MLLVSHKHDNKTAVRLRELLKDYKTDYMLNWGGTYAQSYLCLNPGIAVARATDKVECFRFWRKYGIPTPEFTTVKAEAQRWLDAGYTVLARDNFKARSEGMVTVMPIDTLPEKKKDFYVKFIYDIKDIRVHVFDGETLAVQTKTDDDRWIISAPPYPFDMIRRIERIAKAAVTALRLDFGAVDLGVDPEGNVVVFEVNTAPSLGEIMVTRYANAAIRYTKSM